MLLGVGCSRDDVAGIPLTDALPQKGRARAPGADIRGVGLFAVSGLPVWRLLIDQLAYIESGLPTRSATIYALQNARKLCFE
jgi:hypothetical protein